MVIGLVEPEGLAGTATASVKGIEPAIIGANIHHMIGYDWWGVNIVSCLVRPERLAGMATRSVKGREPVITGANIDDANGYRE